MKGVMLYSSDMVPIIYIVSLEYMFRVAGERGGVCVLSYFALVYAPVRLIEVPEQRFGR